MITGELINPIIPKPSFFKYVNKANSMDEVLKKALTLLTSEERYLIDFVITAQADQRRRNDLWDAISSSILKIVERNESFNSNRVNEYVDGFVLIHSKELELDDSDIIDLINNPWTLIVLCEELSRLNWYYSQILVLSLAQNMPVKLLATWKHLHKLIEHFPNYSANLFNFHLNQNDSDIFELLNNILKYIDLADGKFESQRKVFFNFIKDEERDLIERFLIASLRKDILNKTYSEPSRLHDDYLKLLKEMRRQYNLPDTPETWIVEMFKR